MCGWYFIKMLVTVVPNHDVGGTLSKWWRYQLVMLVPITIDGDGTNENVGGTNLWHSLYSTVVMGAKCGAVLSIMLWWYQVVGAVLPSGLP